MGDCAALVLHNTGAEPCGTMTRARAYDYVSNNSAHWKWYGDTGIGLECKVLCRFLQYIASRKDVRSNERPWSRQIGYSRKNHRNTPRTIHRVGTYSRSVGHDLEPGDRSKVTNLGVIDESVEVVEHESKNVPRSPYMFTNLHKAQGPSARKLVCASQQEKKAAGEDAPEYTFRVRRSQPSI